MSDISQEVTFGPGSLTLKVAKGSWPTHKVWRYCILNIKRISYVLVQFETSRNVKLRYRTWKHSQGQDTKATSIQLPVWCHSIVASFTPLDTDQSNLAIARPPIVVPKPEADQRTMDSGDHNQMIWAAVAIVVEWILVGTAAQIMYLIVGIIIFHH